MAGDGAMIGTAGAPAADRLVAELAAIEKPRIVEVGTLRSDPTFPTHHTAWAPHGTWLRVDATAGQDVDLVDDAHTLGHVGRVVRGVDIPAADRDMFGVGPFHAYVACSVWEHLERPWVAMAAAAGVVRPGGFVYVQTHQTFPLHGYPSDFFRFSTDALRVLAEDAGLEVVETSYIYPCRIEPPPEVTRWNRAPDVMAYLNVEVLARRPARG